MTDNVTRRTKSNRNNMKDIVVLIAAQEDKINAIDKRLKELEIQNK